jgi:hypothetical protein
MAAPRKRVPLWVWLTAGFFAFWLGGLAYIFYLRQNIPSTGDDLLDFYLDHANESGAFSEEDLTALKSSFIADPRVWDLLLGSNENSAKDYSVVVRQAMDSGTPLSEGALRNHIDCLENIWAHEWPRPDGQRSKLSRAERQKRDIENARKLSAQVDSKHQEERDALYAKLREIAPQTSMTWYSVAELAFYRGEYEQAVKAIEQGNAAEYNGFNDKFYLKRYYQDLESGGVLTRHPGRIILAQQTLTINANYPKVKRVFMGLFNQALDRKDTVSLNTLHDFAYRVGTPERADIFSALIAAVLFKYEADHCFAKGGLNSMQQQELTDLVKAADKIKVEAKQISYNLPSEKYINGAGSLMSVARIKIGIDTPGSVLHEDQVWGRQQLQAKVYPLLNQIAEFDWAKFYELREDGD